MTINTSFLQNIFVLVIFFGYNIHLCVCLEREELFYVFVYSFYVLLQILPFLSRKSSNVIICF